MDTSKFNIAVLIDGDNAQAKLIKEILQEVSKHGKATIRRIYGDWTTSTMNSWKEIINQYSINPIQKFSYTTGKNSTDSSMIIDAMDILHSGNIQGFCIVSSDSDYTGLAKRIREEGLFVMGIGKRTTPTAFVQSCEIFTFTENLLVDIAAQTEAKISGNLAKADNNLNSTKTSSTKTPIYSKSLPKIDIDLIDKAFEISSGEEEETFISTIGSSLRKIDPSFDPRTYGFKSLTKLLENITKYKVVKNIINGSNHPLIKLK